MTDQQDLPQGNHHLAAALGAEALRAVLILSAGVFAICILILATGIIFLIDLFSGPFGVFSVLSMLLYLFSAFIAVQDEAPKVLGLLAQGNKISSLLRAALIRTAALVALCIFMALESVEWLRPLFVQDASVNGLRMILVAAFSQTPEKIGLDAALLVGIARMALFAGLAYGAGYLIYRRDDVAKRLDDPAFNLAARTIGIFLAFFALGIAFRLFGGAIGGLLGGWADISLALYVLAMMMERHNKRPQIDRGP